MQITLPLCAEPTALPTSKAALLASADKLSYSDRIGTAARIGADNRGSSQLTALISQLREVCSALCLHALERWLGAVQHPEPEMPELEEEKGAEQLFPASKVNSHFFHEDQVCSAFDCSCVSDSYCIVDGADNGGSGRRQGDYPGSDQVMLCRVWLELIRSAAALRRRSSSSSASRRLFAQSTSARSLACSQKFEWCHRAGNLGSGFSRMTKS